MKKIFQLRLAIMLVLFCFLALPTILQAQEVFHKSYTQWGNATHCIQTNDGGYAIIGGFNQYYFYLIKVDSLGNRQWSKKYGNRNINVSRLVQTEDDGFILAGGISAFPSGSARALFLKIDSLGEVEWVKKCYQLWYGGFSSVELC